MAVQIIDSLRRRRSIVLVSTALAGAALGVAGCGGDSETGASPSETASYVPAGSPFYLEATTDFDGPQWTQVDGLAKMFPAYPELRAELDQTLRSDDVDFETEVKPLLGERAAIAGLDIPDAAAIQGSLSSPDAVAAAGAAAAAADAQEFVGVVEIADGKSDAVKALLTKSGATAAGEHAGAAVYTSDDDTVAAVNEDVLVVSDTKQQVFAALDAHAAGGDKTLAGTSRFSDAIGKLPADVFGQAFFDIGGAVQQAGTSSPQLGQLGLSEYQNAVLAASIAAEPDGLRVKGVLTGAPDTGASEFSPSLTEKAPADAIAYVGFDDISTTLTNALAQAQASQGAEARKQFEAIGGQLPMLLGVSLDDLAALGSGEQSVVVTSGPKDIGVALSSQVADGAKATTTLDALRAGLPALLGTFSPGAQAPKATQVPLAAGVKGWRIPVGDQSVVYGVDGDLVIVGNSVPAVTAVQRPTTPLSSSADFEAGTSGMPGDVTSIMWVNVEQALAAAQKAGALMGADAKDIAQLRPIKSLSGWTTGGDTPTFEMFVRIAG